MIMMMMAKKKKKKMMIKIMMTLKWLTEMLATEPDDLSLIIGTHKREN